MLLDLVFKTAWIWSYNLWKVDAQVNTFLCEQNAEVAHLGGHDTLQVVEAN